MNNCSKDKIQHQKRFVKGVGPEYVERTFAEAGLLDFPDKLDGFVKFAA